MKGYVSVGEKVVCEAEFMVSTKEVKTSKLIGDKSLSVYSILRLKSGKTILFFLNSLAKNVVIGDNNRLWRMPTFYGSRIGNGNTHFPELSSLLVPFLKFRPEVRGETTAR